MKVAIDAWLGQRTARWVAAVQAKPIQVLTLIGATTLLCAVVAVLKLGINSNNLDLISPELESRINHAEFSELFPNLENALIVVVDGTNHDRARDAANQLVDRLNTLSDTIEQAYLPQGGAFFEKNGLLYLNQDQFDDFSDKLTRAHPLIRTLEPKPNLINLAAQVRVGMTITRGDRDHAEIWTPLLKQISLASEQVLAPQNDQYGFGVLDLSLLDQSNGLELSKRQIIIAHPKLEFGSILAANRSIKAIRAAAQDLDLSEASGVSVRVTGNPALNLEEMIGIAWDIGVAGLFCFALVVVILTMALRSFPLVVATVATLVIGLVWTAGFAALAVGHLNIVSLSVAILFIGLGVDFAIHLGMRYADSLRAGMTERPAMQAATKEVGSSLVICTISTAIAFFVFVPTPYLGVAELGLIAGAGMIIILFLTFTLYPALLVSWLRFDASKHIKSELKFEASLGLWVLDHGALVRWTALVLLIVGLWMVPKARFDPNVIDMRDPSTESVQAFNELLDESGLKSPWYVDAVAPDLRTAKQLVQAAEALPQVEQAISIAQFVPENQTPKIERLQELALLYSPPEVTQKPIAPTDEERTAAIAQLNDFLKRRIRADQQSDFNQAKKVVSKHLSRLLKTQESEHLIELEQNLLSSVPEQIDRLRTALSAERVSLAQLPSTLRERMLTPEGKARVQFFPKENLRDEANLRSFVDAIAALAPKASGIAMNLIAFEEATIESFQQALLSAVILISILLIILWRNTKDVLLVLAPLFLSLILAVAAMAALDLPFNFVNVIVIPLMFGIGVDSGIHLVHRSHATITSGDSLLGTTTARAVYYSALTTFISFGSLSLSGHRGMASLGTLLAIGMALTVLCNLVLLPALLQWLRPQSGRKPAMQRTKIDAA